MAVHVRSNCCTFRSRPHESGSIFFNPQLFFPNTATVHTHPMNSTANPDKSALQSGKNKSETNTITFGRVNPDIFESDDVQKRVQSLIEKLTNMATQRANLRHYRALYGTCSKDMLLQRSPGY